MPGLHYSQIEEVLALNLKKVDSDEITAAKMNAISSGARAAIALATARMRYASIKGEIPSIGMFEEASSATP